MPTVLLVLDSLVPAGAESSTVALLPHLIDRGFCFELAVLHDRPGLHDEVRALGVPIHDLSGDGGRLGWIKRSRTLLGERRPDLVHTSLFEADVCGRISAFSRHIPVVSTLATESYGTDQLEAPHIDRKRLRAGQLLDAVTARATRRLHAISEHVAESVARQLRYPRSRIDVVYRGRPDRAAGAAPDRASARAALDLGADCKVVLITARQDYVKGIDRVIEAMPAVVGAMPGAMLLVAGREGQHTPDLRRRVEQLGLDKVVRFLGHRSDVRELLALSDAFVLPSRREGLSSSLLEAIAEETPAVVHDLPVVREVVSSSEALIVDAGQPSQLATGIIKTLTRIEDSAERAERARKRFLATFTMDHAADGMVEFYRRALSP